MATRTFTTAGVNNLWSNAANWDTGVPLNTDTAVIPVGQDCEFDVDQSGFAAGITVTLNGTLHASTTAGSYVLKLQANMTGSGTLRAGTSGTPYPTNCTFTINRNGFEITATNITLDLNCSEPTHKYIKLSGVEAAGQTVLGVDTDVTGESAYWADGATIRIDDANQGAESEERVITVGGVAAGTITITAGLTAQKETGSYVILISRNVKITHTANTGNAVNGNNGSAGGRVYAEIQGASNAIVNANNYIIGGTISDVTTGISTFDGCTVYASISGATNGLSGGGGNIVDNIISGCTNGVSSGAGYVFLSTAIITGCTDGIRTSPAGHTLLGMTIANCTNGIRGGGGLKFINVTFTNNTNDLIDVSDFYAFNTTFGSTTEFSGYNGDARGISAFAESIDHDATAGAFKAWCRGGIVTNNIVTVYPGRTVSYQHACESSSYYVFRNYSVTVESGGGLVVQCYIRKDAAMAYLPRVWILLPGNEPFITGTADYEDIMTNSINTWEELNLVYANGGTAPVTVTVRTLAKDAGPSNVYFDPIITTLAPATYSVFNVLQADLDDIQTRLPAALVGGRMDSSVGAMANNVLTAAAIATNAIDADALANDAVLEIQAGLSTLTSAQVNTEIVDALAVDTYPEPIAVPAATSSLKDKLNWLFALARNPIRQTATQQTLRNDADGANIGTAQVSDNGVTATRDKWV